MHLGEGEPFPAGTGWSPRTTLVTAKLVNWPQMAVECAACRGGKAVPRVLPAMTGLRCVDEINHALSTAGVTVERTWY